MSPTHHEEDQHGRQAMLAFTVGQVAAVLTCGPLYVLTVFVLEELYAPPLQPLGSFSGFGFWVICMLISGVAIGALFPLLVLRGAIAWSVLFASVCYFSMRFQSGLISPFAIRETVCFAQVIVAAILYLEGVLTYFLFRWSSSRQEGSG